MGWLFSAGWLEIRITIYYFNNENKIRHFKQSLLKMIDFMCAALLLFAMTKQILHQKTVLTAHPALNGLSLKSVELIPTCPSHLSFSLCPSERLSLTPKLKQHSITPYTWPALNPLPLTHCSVSLVCLSHLYTSNT